MKARREGVERALVEGDGSKHWGRAVWWNKCRLILMPSVGHLVMATSQFKLACWGTPTALTTVALLRCVLYPDYFIEKPLQ